MVDATGQTIQTLSLTGVYSASCSGFVVVTPEDYAKLIADASPFEPLNPSLATADAVELFGLGLAFLVSIWAAKQLYVQFTRDRE